MKTWRIVAACLAATAALIVLTISLASGPSPARAEAALSPTPSPHLGYGINVRSQSVISPLFAPLGFEWLKLWEEYGVSVTTRYPYQVLYLIDCARRSWDLTGWGNHVQAIAEAGRGLIEAYEICNEPNRRGWLSPDVPPDPARYAQMFQVAYTRIKAVGPAAIVVSGGLAPVGRIQGGCNGWSGNDCGAMDERKYARHVAFWSNMAWAASRCGRPSSTGCANGTLRCLHTVFFGPRLAVEPASLTFLADVDEPGILTATVTVLNAGYRVLTWTAEVMLGMQVTRTLAITSGARGAPLVVDSTGTLRALLQGVSASRR